MFEINLPDGFSHVKELCCNREYWKGFSYNIEIISVIRNTEGKYYIRQYRNTCDSGANGRPETTVRDVGYMIGPVKSVSRIKADNWKNYVSFEQLLHPDAVFEYTSEVNVDTEALAFAKAAIDK